jgi:hypothetical protein
MVFDSTLGSKHEADQEATLRQLRDSSNGLQVPEGTGSPKGWWVHQRRRSQPWDYRLDSRLMVSLPRQGRVHHTSQLRKTSRERA